MRLRAVLAAAAVLVVPAATALAGLPESADGKPWFEVPRASLAEFPRPAAPPLRFYELGAHMDLTYDAYLLYASRYQGSELSQYIGGHHDGAPDDYAADNVLSGAYLEDVPYRNPWNEQLPMLRHFWKARTDEGLSGNDTAVNRAQKYFTGGFGLDGAYDAGWTGGGNDSGVKALGIVALYGAGNKDKAYWYLGHAAHLLEDLTVPAHALLFPHPFGTDAYESYMTGHRREFLGQRGDGNIPDFASLRALYHDAAATAAGFDAGTGPGSSGVDGDRDRGARRAAGFTPPLLKEEGDALWPLACRDVAALFVYFFRQIDHTPPRAELDPPRLRGTVVALRARARDSQSGVDRRGFRFEYARQEPAGWSGWQPIASAGSPRAEISLPAGSYEFRVWSVDAAGNAGRSRARRLTIEPPQDSGSAPGV